METCIVSSPPQQRDWTELGHCCGRAVQSIPNFANEMTIDGVLPLSSSVTVAESGADGMNPCVTLNPHHTHTYTHTEDMWTHGVWIRCDEMNKKTSGCDFSVWKSGLVFLAALFVIFLGYKMFFLGWGGSIPPLLITARTRTRRILCKPPIHKVKDTHHKLIVGACVKCHSYAGRLQCCVG